MAASLFRVSSFSFQLFPCLSFSVGVALVFACWHVRALFMGLSIAHEDTPRPQSRVQLRGFGWSFSTLVVVWLQLFIGIALFLSIYLYIYIYIYGLYLCVAGFDDRVLLHSGLDMVIMRACT